MKTTKYTNKTLFFGAFIALMFAFFSCSNIITQNPSESSDSTPQGKARISIAVDQNAMRTIFPDEESFEDMEYVLEGFLEGGEQAEGNEPRKPTVKKEWNSYSKMAGDKSIFVEKGDWTFKLTAGRSGNVLLSGTITVNVASADFPLTFALTENAHSLEHGFGSAEITLILPNDAEITKVEAGLLTVGYEHVKNFGFKELAINKWNSVTYSANGIPSGVYIVQFKFYGSGKYEIKPGYSEIIHIRDGRMSSAERKIQSIANLHIIKYENISGATFKGYTLQGSLNEYERILLPTADEILMADCTFGGWFYDADFSGDAITEIPAGTAEDVTVYAKWTSYEIASENIAAKATAIAYDGKVHISWAASKDDNYVGARVYLADIRTKIGEAEKRSSSVYGDYFYLCYDDASVVSGTKFEIRALHRYADESVNCSEVAAVETSIPVVMIDTTDSADVASKTKKIPATMNIMNSDKTLENATLTIKGRGNSSWGMAKKSYTLKLDSKNEVLGMNEHKTWAMIANYSDKTLLRNSIAYQMGREIFTNMSWNPNTKNVHFYLNGCYIGIYMLTESVKIDKNRVNVPNLEDYKKKGGEISDYGFLLEVNTRLDESFNFTTTKGVKFSLKEPDGADISTELQQIIQETTQKAEDALYSDDFTDSTSENFYENYFDVDSFIDWWLVNEIAKNRDACFFSSCYLYFDPTDQKLHMGPLWDFDIGFGNDGETNCGKLTGDFYIKNAGWIARMFQDENFTTKAKARWNEKYSELATYFASDESNASYVKTQFSTLTSDANLNFTRWQILGTYVWPNAAGYADRKTYESECDYFNNWISARIEWLNTAINDL